MQTSTCSLIIPVYNEADRLRKNLPLFQSLGGISEIIIVDDGSTDGCADNLDLLDKVTVIHLEENQGKTFAVKQALNLVKTSHVFLIDADLKQLKPREVELGIERALHDPLIDMIIFIRKAWGNMASVYSGERIVKTSLLHEALQKYSQAERFQLEAAINQYCLDQQKQVGWLPLSASNTFQIQKKGVLGLLETPKTIGEIVSLVGWKNYTKQLFQLARRKLVGPSPFAN